MAEVEENISDHQSDNVEVEDFEFEEPDEDLELNEENLQDFKEKVRRSGVVYFSYIPEGLNVSTLRKKLESYGITRIYLVPEKSSIQKGGKKQNYKEGWAEFSDKMYAKLCEYELNGQMVGGKKRNNDLREEIWTIKYLNKFKWHHLMEKLEHNKKMREQKLKVEIAQSRRENNFISQKFEQSKLINRLNKKKVYAILIPATTNNG